MIRKFAAVSALAWACSAQANGLSLELGRGDEGSYLARTGIELPWEKKWALSEDWQLGGYWEFSICGWQNGERVTALAATPVFRIERASSALAPFIEAAIGINLLSQVELSSRRVTGSRFQFGDHIGVGVRFGEQRRHEIGVRLQHLSNGGVEKPNPGMNFGIVRYQYNFE